MHPLSQSAAFQQGIGERCDEPPMAQDATLVWSYRFLEG